MKPIIIKVEEKQGKIELTEEELQEYIEQAYNQGWTDGYESGKAFTYPVSPWNPSPSTPISPYTIWCGTSTRDSLATIKGEGESTQAVIVKKKTTKKK